tara:strand:+ start:3444 stop:4130 length:687 start_codon:yes stop_codon:yes gene_type:complete
MIANGIQLRLVQRAVVTAGVWRTFVHNGTILHTELALGTVFTVACGRIEERAFLTFNKVTRRFNVTGISLISTRRAFITQVCDREFVPTTMVIFHAGRIPMDTIIGPPRWTGFAHGLFRSIVVWDPILTPLAHFFSTRPYPARDMVGVCHIPTTFTRPYDIIAIRQERFTGTVFEYHFFADFWLYHRRICGIDTISIIVIASGANGRYRVGEIVIVFDIFERVGTVGA